jgi:tetratricopeptide (TPR) repeat protein
MTYIISISLIWACIFADQPSYGSTVEGRAGEFVNAAEKYSKSGDHTNALRHILIASKMAPGDMELIYSRAAIYGRAGFYAQAVKDLSRVIREDEFLQKRRYPSARKFRAECLAILGQYVKSSADYQWLLKRHPGNGNIWYYLAELYAVMLRNDLALAAIDKGLSTKSHWKQRLKLLQKKIILGESVSLHAPFSN